MRRNKSLLIMVQCALLLSVALVFRYFSQMIPIAGVGGMRISISVFFSKMPSLLFGPAYGAVTSGLADFLGWVIRPDEGAYIFPMTLTAALGGLIAGAVFKLIKKFEIKSIHRILYVIITLHFGLFGILNHINATVFRNSSFGQMLNSLGEKRLPFFTYGFLFCFVIGMLFYIINIIIEKLTDKPYADLYMKVFITLLCANIPVTTINTFILRWFYDGLAKLPFSVVFAPRIIEEIITTFITAYVLTYLYKLITKFNKKLGLDLK